MNSQPVENWPVLALGQNVPKLRPMDQPVPMWGADEMAKTQVQIAQEALTDEEYYELVNALKKAKIAPTRNLFRRGK